MPVGAKTPKPRMKTFPSGVVVIEILDGNTSEFHTSWLAFRFSIDEKIDKIERKLMIRDGELNKRLEVIESQFPIPE